MVFIISSLGSGGAERVLSLLANELSKKYSVTIVTFSKEKPFYEIDSKIELIQLDLLKISKNRFDSLKNTINRILVLKKVLKEINADINVSFMTHTNILSIVASKLNNQKIIIAERITYNFYNSKILNIFRKLIYPKANILVTQTKADKKHYIFLDNIKVIYNPVNLPKIKEEKEKIMLAVGRLDKQKGFDNLIEIFSNIKSDDWKLIIVGDGVEKENLYNLIKKLNLNNVELIGKRKDIFKWYAKASIFVLSSKKEGFPNVLIEAMAFKCAVISFDCPYGPSEIIENKINGILIENQNKEKLAKAIQNLIDDKNLRERLGKEAIKVRQKYCLEKIVREWESVIKGVVDD